MDDRSIISYLEIKLNFSKDSIKKIKIYLNELLKVNKSYNLIGKSTETQIWHRHVLDSAQVVNLIQFSDNKSLSDLGSGAGFPGLILAIYNRNPKFHVKLYEKSPIKCNFLRNMINNLKINAKVYEGDFANFDLKSDYFIARAFKKIDVIIQISREIEQKSHKFIILKGKNAQEELKNSSKAKKIKYRLVNSVTDKDSKIIVIDNLKKNEK